MGEKGTSYILRGYINEVQFIVEKENDMIQVLVRFTVEDQAKWKPVFEQASELRKQFGSAGVRAFARADNPNELFIIGDYADKAKAMEMFQSQEFREATARAGVKGPPEVTFLNEVVNLAA
jgi:quinol monooxygenase YgiN